MKYSKLQTGKQYTLKELFSLDRKIIIPDLQRDYCWGSKREGKELVTEFLANLVKGFENNSSELSLGLIYGYEAPAKHIQLCDGQQRLTTLFLILGMLNKYSNNAFKESLISDFEVRDDREPYLQYSIRESSLYFLSDLVSFFFLSCDELEVKKIYRQVWYFTDYNYDPSIQSMLNALEIIENNLNNYDARSLGEYLISKLSFVYYDMGNRKNGEETFVVINTTGEPLSATENLKPLFINAQKESERIEASHLWEIWETWFWKHRKGSGRKENDTADNGFNEFFRWITLLTTDNKDVIERIQENGDFKFDINININDIKKYFNIIQRLFVDSGLFYENLDWLSPDKSTKNRNDQIAWFKLLPVIEYIFRFGDEDIRKVQRVKVFFDNLARIENVKKAIGDILPHAISIIKELPDDDIASITKIKNVTSQILSEEEFYKFKLYIGNPDRLKYEDLFWKEESHPIWSGEIRPLLHWSEKKGKFDISRFIQLSSTFNSIFHDDCEYSELDITRRALLTRGMKNYPNYYTGYTNLSFCYEFSDWQTLIKDNEQLMGGFISDLVGKDYIKAQEQMINDYAVKSKWYEFVKNPELLQYCVYKNIQEHDDDIYLILKQKATKYVKLNTYLLYLELNKKNICSVNWKLGIWDQDNSCVDYKNEISSSFINIIYCGANKHKLQLFIWNAPAETKKRFRKISNDYKLNFKDNRYESSELTLKKVIELTRSLINEPTV